MNRYQVLLASAVVLLTMLAAAPARAATLAEQSPTSVAAGADERSTAATRGLPCDTLGICGKVTNSCSSTHSIGITTKWPYFDSAHIRYLRPCQSSRDIGVRDADGFRIFIGCHAYAAIGASLMTLHGLVDVDVDDPQSASVRTWCP